MFEHVASVTVDAGTGTATITYEDGYTGPGTLLGVTVTVGPETFDYATGDFAGMTPFVLDMDADHQPTPAEIAQNQGLVESATTLDGFIFEFRVNGRLYAIANKGSDFKHLHGTDEMSQDSFIAAISEHAYRIFASAMNALAKALAPDEAAAANGQVGSGSGPDTTVSGGTNNGQGAQPGGAGNLQQGTTTVYKDAQGNAQTDEATARESFVSEVVETHQVAVGWYDGTVAVDGSEDVTGHLLRNDQVAHYVPQNEWAQDGQSIVLPMGWYIGADLALDGSQNQDAHRFYISTEHRFNPAQYVPTDVQGAYTVKAGWYAGGIAVDGSVDASAYYLDATQLVQHVDTEVTGAAFNVPVGWYEGVAVDGSEDVTGHEVSEDHIVKYVGTAVTGGQHEVPVGWYLGVAVDGSEDVTGHRIYIVTEHVTTPVTGQAFDVPVGWYIGVYTNGSQPVAGHDLGGESSAQHVDTEVAQTSHWTVAGDSTEYATKAEALAAVQLESKSVLQSEVSGTTGVQFDSLAEQPVANAPVNTLLMDVLYS